MSRLRIVVAMFSFGIFALGASNSQATILSPMSSEVRDVLWAIAADTEQPVLARMRGGGFRAGAAGRTRVAAGHRGIAASRTRVAAGSRGVAARRTTVVKGPRGNVAVRRTTVVGGRGVVAARGVAVVGAVRPWVRRPYYGTVVAGITLGTIIAATAIPPAPSSEVCWYWSNSPHTRGYWDYCQPPQ
jgi:hypothetical protein